MLMTTKQVRKEGNMTKEFLLERIAKAEETITKKQGTITKKTASIQKKSEKFLKDFGMEWMTVDKYDSELPNHNEMYWDICDIEHLQDDIIRLEHEIAEKQKSLAGYQEQLQVFEEKEASRNITVILEFLEGWKERNIEFYQEAFGRYTEALHEFHQKNHEWVEYYNRSFKIRKTEEFKQVEAEYRTFERNFHSTWNFITPYVERSAGQLILNLTKLQKDLDVEANRKYDFIIERTNAIVGQITDASNLKVGAKADLNGFIIGTKGTAKVETIGAGGYNIQCFHFRTLINAM